ncbi:MAG: flagellar hook-length control protein FliK, partial [Gammaproteobacteria bacterium]|nr:flagellar hook-length control protein FliK [Gammaproteobacteria bacterium]
MQALTGEEGQGFDDFLHQGFSHLRDQLGAQVGAQLGQQPLSGDDALKGFNQIMGQLNARPLAAAPVTAAEAAANALNEPKPLDTPVGSKQWSQGVGERIQWMMNRGLEQAQIRLNPQHLGPLEIRLSMLNDHANVSIVAQHAVTREAIEQSLPRLREMLQEANVNLGDVDLSQRDAPNQQEQAQRGRAPDGRGFANELEGDGASEELPATVAVP